MTIHLHSRPNELREGIFGQCLIWILEVLGKLEQDGVLQLHSRVTFDIHTQCNGNLIPRYIVPIVRNGKGPDEQAPLKINIAAYKRTVLPDGKQVFPLEEASFEKASVLFHRHFKVHPRIQSIVDAFPSACLGVHYRGTDKMNCTQATPITREEVQTIIRDYIVHCQPPVDRILCCSDEMGFAEELRGMFPRISVYNYQQPLAHVNQREGLFRAGKTASPELRDKLTVGSIVDMLLLAKCDVILKTSSALSCFSKIINPRVRVLSMSAMRKPWFPTAVTYPYAAPSHSASARILRRTMQGHVFRGEQ